VFASVQQVPSARVAFTVKAPGALLAGGVPGKQHRRARCQVTQGDTLFFDFTRAQDGR
jgi:hypothetical protein